MIGDPVVEVIEAPVVVTVTEYAPVVTTSEPEVVVTVNEGTTTEVTVASDTVINIIDESTEVIVDAYTDPIVNVYLGGVGGLPGFGSGDYSWFDVAAFVEALNGSITKGQLSIDLSTQIDEASTGLIQANANLDAAILNYEAGMQEIDALDTRITQAEDNINLSVSRLNVAEADIQTASLDITDVAIRTTVAEADIGSHEARLVAQETLNANEWTVKIQDNSDGTAYAAGVGLLVYPDWLSGEAITTGDFRYFEGSVYKALTNHVTDLVNQPPSTSWELVPNGVKSQFGVLADSFFVQSISGDKKVPFLVQNDLVSIDGDLMASGTIHTTALNADVMTSWICQSFNYVPAVSGWKIDAVNNIAEFNDITMSWNSITDQPASLSDISPDEAAKLAGIAAGATVGAPTGTYIGSVLAQNAAAWSSDPAARINSVTTTISGGKITTGSITAAQVDVASLRAAIISANTIYADNIVAGNITTAKLNGGAVTTDKVYTNAVTQNYAASSVDAYSLTLTTNFVSTDPTMAIFIFFHVTTEFACTIEFWMCNTVKQWQMTLPVISYRTDGWLESQKVISRGLKLNTAADGTTCSAILKIVKNHTQDNYGPWSDASISIIGCKR